MLTFRSRTPGKEHNAGRTAAGVRIALIKLRGDRERFWERTTRNTAPDVIQKIQYRVVTLRAGCYEVACILPTPPSQTTSAIGLSTCAFQRQRESCSFALPSTSWIVVSVSHHPSMIKSLIFSYWFTGRHRLTHNSRTRLLVSRSPAQTPVQPYGQSKRGLQAETNRPP